MTDIIEKLEKAKAVLGQISRMHNTVDDKVNRMTLLAASTLASRVLAELGGDDE